MESNKGSKVLRGLGAFLLVISLLGYLAYKGITLVAAFRVYPPLFALATLIPVFGDLFYGGARIFAGDWIPFLAFSGIGAAFAGAEALVGIGKE